MQAAHMRGIGGGVHLQFEATGALRRVLLGGIAHHGTQRLVPAHRRAGDVVEPLEPVPAALVIGDVERDVVDELAGGCPYVVCQAARVTGLGLGEGVGGW